MYMCRCGNGAHGQLGFKRKFGAGSSFVRTTQIMRPQPVDAFRKVEVTRVEAGERHSMAVAASGELYTWGLRYRYSYNCA